MDRDYDHCNVDGHTREDYFNLPWRPGWSKACC